MLIRWRKEWQEMRLAGYSGHITEDFKAQVKHSATGICQGFSLGQARGEKALAVAWQEDGSGAELSAVTWFSLGPSHRHQNEHLMEG